MWFARNLAVKKPLLMLKTLGIIEGPKHVNSYETANYVSQGLTRKNNENVAFEPLPKRVFC